MTDTNGSRDLAATTTTRFTVGIPSLNRPEGLMRTLASLQAQSFADFEIIVADNSPDSNLRELVSSRARESRVPLRYAPQPRGGLQQARSRIVVEARGAVIVLLDDDETAGEDLLRTYDARFREFPEMAAAGGPYRLTWLDEPPEWIREYIRGKRELYVWGLYEPYDEPIVRRGGVNLWGGNLAVRREVFQTTGFRPELYRGLCWGSGEAGFVKELAEGGALLGYFPDAIVFHYLLPSRWSIGYVRGAGSHLGMARSYMHWYPRRRSLAAGLRHAGAVVRRYARSWLKAAYLAASRRPLTPDNVDTQYVAAIGFYEVYFVWLMLFNPLMKRFLAQTDFRPEACLDMAADL